MNKTKTVIFFFFEEPPSPAQAGSSRQLTWLFSLYNCLSCFPGYSC